MGGGGFPLGLMDSGCGAPGVAGAPGLGAAVIGRRPADLGPEEPEAVAAAVSTTGRDGARGAGLPGMMAENRRRYYSTSGVLVCSYVWRGLRVSVGSIG